MIRTGSELLFLVITYDNIKAPLTPLKIKKAMKVNAIKALNSHCARDWIRTSTPRGAAT